MGILRRDRSRVSVPDGKPVTIGTPSSVALREIEDSLVASARVLNELTPDQTAEVRRVLQPWQQQAMAYYQTVGEAWYAGQFYARPLSKLRLYAAEVDNQGEIKELDPGTVPAEQLARIKDRGSTGRRLFQYRYGVLRFVIGEGYMVGTNQDEEEVWEYLSPDEWRVNASSTGNYAYTRMRAPGLNPWVFGKASPEIEGEAGKAGATAWVARLYRSHPLYSEWADSPMNAVLQLFGELELLTLAVAAQTKSRIAQAGILGIASELSFGGATATQNEDPMRDPFFEGLTKAMTTAIQQPGSAAAVVPVVLRGPAEILEKGIVWQQIGSPMEKYPEMDLRKELLGRIATGLDLPAEILTGIASANHWTAWQIDDATWSTNIQPVAEEMCQDLTHAWLRRACKAAGYPNWENVLVWYDAADVVNHPDRLKDALEIHDRGGLSLEAVREAGGFSDEDAMSDEEHEEWLALQLKSPAKAEEQAGEDEDLLANTPATAPAAPPEEKDEVEVEESEITAAAVMGACELAAYRVRELAGSRLRSKVDKLPAIDGLDNGLVASALAAAGVQTEVRVDDLVRGGTGSLLAFCQQKGIAASSAERLCDHVTSHAAKHLFEADPPALPDGIGAYIKRIL